MNRLKPTSLRQSRNLHKDDLSEEQNQPFVEQSPHCNEDDGPNIDTASTTRSGCIGAISLGIILSFLCLISGIYILRTNQTILGSLSSISTSGQEVLALAVNLVLTLSTDGMMFVHSVSLRWALYREERLEYNTNIRLFTSSKKFGPNKWYINVVALSCLVISYASSSVLLLSNQAELGSFGDTTHPPMMANATALVALGLGLAGQTIVATWCLLSSSKLIPTWSSNPLNTASAAMQMGNLSHRPGRCMLSVHQRHVSTQVYPAKRQASMFQVLRTVRYILALLWTLAVLAIAWPVAIAIDSMSIGKASAVGQNVEPSCWRFGFDWNRDYSACSRNDVTLSLSPYANDHNPNSATFSYGAEAVLCVLFVCLIQASQTIALHCLELLVNLSRDEGVWRQAYGETKEAPGTQLATNPFRAAVSSWENIVLFIAKAVLHWVIGQSLLPSVVVEATGDLESWVPSDGMLPLKYGFQFDMVYSRLVIYAILAVLVAVFGTYLALKRRRGCQPAALGHLQTLVDLIDDWKTDKNGRMWWGDKSQLEADQVRHAGTSWDKTVLGPICTATYAGGLKRGEEFLGRP